MFDEMIGTAEEFYQSLGIPYRIVNIVSGEWTTWLLFQSEIPGIKNDLLLAAAVEVISHLSVIILLTMP